jgi:hypothetical protein
LVLCNFFVSISLILALVFISLLLLVFIKT